jgi:hypothetical protein
MVEHLPRDPEAIQISEREAAPHGPLHVSGGRCLVCGGWIEHDEAGVYRVTLATSAGVLGDFPCHVPCLHRVADASVLQPR